MHMLLGNFSLNSVLQIMGTLYFHFFHLGPKCIPSFSFGFFLIWVVNCCVFLLPNIDRVSWYLSVIDFCYNFIIVQTTVLWLEFLKIYWNLLAEYVFNLMNVSYLLENSIYSPVVGWVFEKCQDKLFDKYLTQVSYILAEFLSHGTWIIEHGDEISDYNWGVCLFLLSSIRFCLMCFEALLLGF